MYVFFWTKINNSYCILTSSDSKLKQKLENILKNNTIDDQSKILLSLINNIAESINKILNIRYNLIERTNSNNDMKFLFSNDLLNDTSQQSQSILEQKLGEVEENYKDVNNEEAEEKNNYKKSNAKKSYQQMINQNDTSNQITCLDRNVKRLPKEITSVLNEW